MCDISHFKLCLLKNPGSTNKALFADTGIENASKTTRNRVIGSFSKVKKPECKPLLTPKHKKDCLKWSKMYTKTDKKHILFTDVCRATLDGPDGWALSPTIGNPTHMRLHSHVWSWNNGDRMIGSFIVSEGVQINVNTYCNFIRDILTEWLNEFPLSELYKVIFMYDKAPPYTIKS